jgi:hypothetical protein
MSGNRAAIIKEFNEACIKGDLARAKRCDVTREEVCAGGMILAACRDGFLDLAQWIADNFNLTGEDIHTSDGIYALSTACEEGHLETAQWMVKRFNITRANVRFTTARFALQDACTKGNLALAQWLATYFEMTRDDTRELHDSNSTTYPNGVTIYRGLRGVNFPLQKACKRGHLAVAQWLVEHFDLKPEDFRIMPSICGFIKEICEKGNLETAQWFIDQADLNSDDVIDLGNGSGIRFTTYGAKFAGIALDFAPNRERMAIGGDLGPKSAAKTH